MKNTLMILTVVFTMATNTFGQTTSVKSEVLKNEIIALEKAGWDAWKNKNAEWFQTNTSEEFLSINSEGISNKSQVIASITDCDVKSVSIDNFGFVVIEKNVVLLTYIATQDGNCGNTRLAPKVRASVNYVKKRGKWLEAFYMETPIKD
ncbi:nuclear transport factor 2 family protein [Mariniflexile sp.]|uniref:nuclear transport factor 2 family protein n=1 Tax=Mariniflexile sp. TaxID=1979402 RepID=UPI004047176A